MRGAFLPAQNVFPRPGQRHLYSYAIVSEVTLLHRRTRLASKNQRFVVTVKVNFNNLFLTLGRIHYDGILV